MRAGGLITHYYSDPMYLEQTMDVSIFTFHDNSKEKLTMEQFLLIFLFLVFGMALAILALLFEILIYRISFYREIRI